MRKLLHTILAALLIFSLPLSAQDENPIQIHQVGQLHGNEVDAEAGPGWWGLFPSKDGMELKKVALSIETVVDPLVDSSGEMTGKRLTVNDERQPLFIVRGIPDLQEGIVFTSFWGRGFLMNNAKLWLGTPMGTQLRLDASGEPYSRGPESELLLSDYRLTLAEMNKGTQEIFRYERVVPYDGPKLLWAGDLDRDGKVDLLYDLKHHYNMTKLTLFLSSLAQEGQVVGLADEHTTTGC